jgi:hypothetical protein
MSSIILLGRSLMNFGDVAAYVIVVALSQVKSAVHVAPTFLCGQSRQVTG